MWKVNRKSEYTFYFILYVVSHHKKSISVDNNEVHLSFFLNSFWAGKLV